MTQAAKLASFGGGTAGGKTARTHKAVMEHLLKVPTAVVLSMAEGRWVRARVNAEGALAWDIIEPADTQVTSTPNRDHGRPAGTALKPL